MNKLFPKILGGVSLFLAAATTLAATNTDFALGTAAKLSRVSVQGFTGEYSGGAGDVMVPLFWDRGRALYFDVAGHYQSKSNNWLVGPGIGYRQVVGETGIFGGYVFADYNKYKDFKSDHYWVINPGVEYIQPTWDLHLNAYLPVSSKHKLLADDWADSFGEYSYVQFEDHTMYNKKMQQYLNLGDGVDASFGILIPKFPRLKASLGGYYFSQRTNELNFSNGPADIIGGFAKLDFAVTKWASLFAHDSYDNVAKNTVTVGVDITFGGSGKGAVNTDMQQHLLDPIVRNETANNYGLSTPATTSKSVYSESASGFDTELNNVYFFNGNPVTQNGMFSIGGNGFTDTGAAADGSYEHPFTADDFNQDRVNNLPSNANVFFNGSGGNGLNIDSLTLQNGQSIYGRNGDYTMPAAGANRFLFLGRMILSGNNTLDSLRLQSNGTADQTGVSLTGVTNNLLNNMQIGDPNNTTGLAYTSGVALFDGAEATITNSNIYAFNSSAGAYGIIVGSSTLTLRNSLVKSVMSGNQHANGLSVVGGGSVVEIYNSQIIAENTSAVREGETKSFGLNIATTGAANRVDVYNSVITASTANGKAWGAYVKDTGSTLNVVNSTINATANSTSGADTAIAVYGVNSNINLSNSTLNATSNRNAYAVYLDSGTTLSFSDTNNNFNVNNTSSPAAGNAYGIYVKSGATNVHVTGDYQHNNYNVQGGANNANWYNIPS